LSEYSYYFSTGIGSVAQLERFAGLALLDSVDTSPFGGVLLDGLRLGDLSQHNHENGLEPFCNIA